MEKTKTINISIDSFIGIDLIVVPILELERPGKNIVLIGEILQKKMFYS